MVLKKTLLLIIISFWTVQAKAQTKTKKPQWVMKDIQEKVHTPTNNLLVTKGRNFRVLNNHNEDERVTAMRLTYFRNGIASNRFNRRSCVVFLPMVRKGDGVNIKILETTNTKTGKVTILTKNNILNIRAD